MVSGKGLLDLPMLHNSLQETNPETESRKGIESLEFIVMMVGHVEIPAFETRLYRLCQRYYLPVFTSSQIYTPHV
jgi:hypothetical protein